MNKEVKVGIADMKIARNEGRLITYALGSCIGITLYDPGIKLGALIHIMLPEATGDPKKMNVFKFADTAIPETLRKLAVFGGRKNRYICKIAGGAQMFMINNGAGIGNIGERNIQSVRRVLQAEGIKIKSQDVGGSCARTMLMDLETGLVQLRIVGKSIVTL